MSCVSRGPERRGRGWLFRRECSGHSEARARPADDAIRLALRMGIVLCFWVVLGPKGCRARFGVEERPEGSVRRVPGEDERYGVVNCPAERAFSGRLNLS